MIKLFLLVCFALSSTVSVDLIQPAQLLCNSDTPQIELTVSVMDLCFSNGLSFTSRVYSARYENESPPKPVQYAFGPTIIVKPGSRCSILFRNALPQPLVPCPHDRSITLNKYGCPETTNLHTHGLFVSPKQDDVSLAIQPGESHLYEFDIPNDHLMGTHWYHAHHHRSTALHVQGGQVGVLLVEPSRNTQIPGDLATLYSERAQILLLQHWLFQNESGRFNQGFGLLGYPSLWSQASSPESSLPLNANFTDSNSDFYTVNAQVAPVVHLAAGESTVLRLVHATGLRIIELGMTNPLVAGCIWQILARDGVFLEEPLSVDTVVLFPGSRADVAILCSSASASLVTVAASPDLRLDPYICTNDDCTSRQVQSVVWSFSIDPGQTFIPIPTSLLPANQYPKYLQNLLLSTELVDVKLLYGDPDQLQLQSGDASQNGLNANGQQFDQSMSIAEISTNSAYRIQLFWRNATLAHPYHQHIVPFQLDILSNLVGGVLATRGEWRDVFPQLVGHSNVAVNMLFSPQRFSGEMVFHCHIFEHEDNGMMGFYQISPSSIMNFWGWYFVLSLLGLVIN